jgi:hypothetical protein
MGKKDQLGKKIKEKVSKTKKSKSSKAKKVISIQPEAKKQLKCQ